MTFSHLLARGKRIVLWGCCFFFRQKQNPVRVHVVSQLLSRKFRLTTQAGAANSQRCLARCSDLRTSLACLPKPLKSLPLLYKALNRQGKKHISNLPLYSVHPDARLSGTSLCTVSQSFPREKSLAPLASSENLRSCFNGCFV